MIVANVTDTNILIPMYVHESALKGFFFRVLACHDICPSTYENARQSL